MAARQSLDARHFKRKSWGSDSLVLFLVVTVLALLRPLAVRGHDGVDGVEEGLPGINGAGARPAVGLQKAIAELEDKLLAEALAHGEELEKLLDIPVQARAGKAVGTPDEAPEGVTVLSRVDLEPWGCRNIAEALQDIAGSYLVVGDDLLPNLPVQGFFGVLDLESGVIKRMVDGHSVVFRATGGNGLGNETLPLSAVECIEIIRGSTAALHGTDAFPGVIAVVTRAAIESRSCSRAFRIHDDFIQTCANSSFRALELPFLNSSQSANRPVAPRQRRFARRVRQRLRASDQAPF